LRLDFFETVGDARVTLKVRTRQDGRGCSMGKEITIGWRGKDAYEAWCAPASGGLDSNVDDWRGRAKRSSAGFYNWLAT
jgi:hypothetical protein